MVECTRFFNIPNQSIRRAASHSHGAVLSRMGGRFVYPGSPRKQQGQQSAQKEYQRLQADKGL